MLTGWLGLWFLLDKISIPVHLYRGLYVRLSPFWHDCSLRCALRRSHLNCQCALLRYQSFRLQERRKILISEHPDKDRKGMVEKRFALSLRLMKPLRGRNTQSETDEAPERAKHTVWDWWSPWEGETHSLRLMKPLRGRNVSQPFLSRLCLDVLTPGIKTQKKCSLNFTYTPLS